MSTPQALIDSPARLPNNNSFLIALAVATVIHVIVGWGIKTSTPQPETVSRAIDITLVNMPSPKAPEVAQALAPENQQGAGEQSQQPKVPEQKQSSPSIAQAQPIKKRVSEKSEDNVLKKIITQKTAENKVVTTRKPDTEQHIKERPHLSADILQQQIAQLGTEIRQSQQSELTKIKFIDSVSAHKYVAAQYMKDWEDKVERTGNLNYPEVAAKKNFSGTLTMDVGIRADGSIYSIRINQSSGNPELDDAAKRIVRMSSPFAPLPADLLKELDILVITRVWKFSDESGMTTP
jgi:protein TonB